MKHQIIAMAVSFPVIAWASLVFASTVRPQLPPRIQYHPLTLIFVAIIGGAVGVMVYSVAIKMLP